mmetsp:Transcript_25634/g.69547  ORF Transcript_25634/g.69547 Transcript_25634/m.69547 type:complete len:225 (-) Transcript_25634:172-846(-)
MPFSAREKSSYRRDSSTAPRLATTTSACDIGLSPSNAASPQASPRFRVAATMLLELSPFLCAWVLEPSFEGTSTESFPDSTNTTRVQGVPLASTLSCLTSTSVRRTWARASWRFSGHSRKKGTKADTQPQMKRTSAALRLLGSCIPNVVSLFSSSAAAAFSRMSLALCNLGGTGFVTLHSFLKSLSSFLLGTGQLHNESEESLKSMICSFKGKLHAFVLEQAVF